MKRRMTGDGGGGGRGVVDEGARKLGERLLGDVDSGGEGLSEVHNIIIA